MGTYKSFHTEAEVEVSLDSWDDADLIEELQCRDYIVLQKDEDIEYEEIKDDIFALYKEWLDDKGDRDNRFEKAMRKFFEKHLDKVSVK